ncbi:MAG: hypothetical protein CMP22_00905 [Rickettsiales bacterium]|nr:hypothetical protein [Rickettsiales bacterium]
MMALLLSSALNPVFAQEASETTIIEETVEQTEVVGTDDKPFDFYKSIEEMRPLLDQDLSYKLKEHDFMQAQEVLPIVPKPKPTSYIGQMLNYSAVYEDTLLDIARSFDLGYVEIAAANPDINHWIPGEGEKVTIPSMHLIPDAPREGIVINLTDMRLYLFDALGQVVKTHPVGIGRDGLATPLGSTTVVRKKEGPWWYPTERMRQEDPSLERVVKAGPENPLGTHALYLGWPTFALHGTIEPWGIGRRVSSGCMRLYPEDIMKLYPQIEIGTKVTVVDQEFKLGWVGHDLYLEIHPSKSQASDIENQEPLTFEAPEGLVERIHEEVSNFEMLEPVDWKTVNYAVLKRFGYPIKIASRKMEMEILEGVDPDLKDGVVEADLKSTIPEKTDNQPVREEKPAKAEPTKIPVYNQ